MKKLLPLLFTFHLLLFTSCGGATPEEMASLAAKGYYEHLMRGEYRQFLEGKEFQPLDTIGTAQKVTNVFLVLCFGDSVNEEIVVPMVERQGRWRMK